MAGIVLLSGGLDSTVSLGLYLEDDTLDLALTFDYGQRSRVQEIKAARLIAAHYDIAHKIISLPFLEEQTTTALVNTEKDLPNISGIDLDNFEQRIKNAADVWVPNRNGLFINIAAVYAENLKPPASIITGFNSEEASSFPDNSLKFIYAINQSLKYSTMQKTTVVSPTSKLTKNDIVREGLRLNIPWHYIWSCYNDQSQLCGTCESCQHFKRALLNNSRQKLVDEIFSDVSQNEGV
ncbi:MAG: 7-cyano-7-deazaguanine synthase QueC [Desulfitobacteriaceae bacterium]|nr:7-cyano-7-deazaguanine synthase QueC [Desulfitobacteriaceae bacterium]